MAATTGIANPNWPALEFEVDFQHGPPGVVTVTRKSINAAYRRVAVRQFAISRGRAYELDQVQAGTLTASVVDPLEYLNPDNATSPFNTGGNTITSYRAVQVSAIWPNQPGSGNLINTGVAGDYDPSFELNPFGDLGLWAKAGGTTTLAQSTAQAFDGTHSLLVTQSAAGSGFGAQNQFRTLPTLTYTFSCYVYPTSGNVTVQVVDANGVTWASGTATVLNAWTRLTVTWTAVDTLEPVTVYGAGATTPTFYMDATMLEFGTSASAFTTTGPTRYLLYSGYVERWPTAYDHSGHRAVRELYAVDALAILSRTVVTQSYAATVATDSPIFRVSYSETAPPSNIIATVGGTVVQGTQVTPAGGAINWAGDTFLNGCPAVVLSQQYQSNITQTPLVTQRAIVDIPHNNTYQISTGGVTFEFWARCVNGAMNVAMCGANVTSNWGAPFNDATNSIWGLVYTASGLAFIYQDAATGAAFPSFAEATATSGSFTADGTNLPDGQWHYYAITLFARPGAPTLYDVAATVDSHELTFTVGNPVRNLGANQVTSLATTEYGNDQAAVAVSNIAVYPANITATRRAAHQQRGTGYSGEQSGARVLRLLNTYWANGFWVTANGGLFMAPDHGYNGRVLLDVLQEIQESERGLVYADVNGNIIFEDRYSRYSKPTPLWVFGENPPGANPTEYPYVDYKTDYDPTFTFSDANLTRPANNAFAPVFNQTTRNNYGQRVLTQQLQTNVDFDLTQAGIFYLNRYSSPRTRISTLTLDPAANPALWPVVLSLELSQKVTVTRRVGSVMVTHDYYIEKIDHKIDATTGSWIVDLQLSPAFVAQAWVLGDATYGVLGSTTVPVY